MAPITTSQTPPVPPTVTNADIDKAIKVRVSFTDDDGYSETLTSSATTSVPVPAPVIVPPEEPQIAQAAGDDGETFVLDTWRPHPQRAERRRLLPSPVPIFHNAQRQFVQYRHIQHVRPEPRGCRPLRLGQLRLPVQSSRLDRRHRRPRQHRNDRHRRPNLLGQRQQARRRLLRLL